MFQVLAPVIVHPTTEARQALGPALRQAGLAAWSEIARRGQGLEYAHLQINVQNTVLAVASRLRLDGYIVIELGLGDPRQAARVIPAAALRSATAQARTAGRR